MDAKSAQRQLQAQVTVPTTASLTSIQLTAIGSAAHLPTDPAATASVAVTDAVVPAATTSQLPVGTLPDVSTPSPSLTPGGNAAGLFPTINPSPSSSGNKNIGARSVADTAALPEGASVVGAQLVGLGALAVAFILAVTRLTIRRRPSLAAGTPGQTGPGTPAAQSGTEDAQPGTTGTDEDAPAPSDGSGDQTPEA